MTEQQGLDPDLLIAPDFILVRMALVDAIGWNPAIVLQRIAFRCNVHPDGWSATIDEICRETRLKPTVVKAALKLLRTRGYLASRRASRSDSTQVWSIIFATQATPENCGDPARNRRSPRGVGIRPPEESGSDLPEESESDSSLPFKELEESSSSTGSSMHAGRDQQEGFAARASACFAARGHRPLVSAPARLNLDRQAATAVAEGLDPDPLIEAALKADSPSGWLASVGMPGLLASRSVPSVTGGTQRATETPSPARYDSSHDEERRSAIRTENSQLDGLVSSLRAPVQDHLAEVAHDLSAGVRTDVARRQAVRAAIATFPDLDPTAAIESWLAAATGGRRRGAR
ncbi:hypothetical protein R4144_00685 [Gordonia amicalis]|uniref:hypothetical protein n=1 Tax=Gordonia amicalis TaxID=89053 RepID=UPI0029558B50|nr:hypothetical protein [Gordonia amicalis]MDV7171932.1 hypothetical protein [Gordonia amicalis]